MKKVVKEKYLKIIFVLIMFAIAVMWTIIQPFNTGPDEKMKMDICKFIVENNALPHGGDERVRDAIWGISYGFTPILAYMISAVFIKIMLLFTSNETAYLFAARLTSILAYTGTIIVVIKIGEKLFKNPYKWIFITLVSCLPQLTFLGTYINNDSLAIFATSIIIYSWIIGLESKWNIKSCILLAIGIGICALSYYNAYGFILTSVIIFIASYFINKKEKFEIKNMLKKGILISLIAIIIAGWWFVRSAIIYDGDFLGLNVTDEYGEKYALEEFKPSKRVTPSSKQESIFQMLIGDKWIQNSVKSFIGVFGGMQYSMAYEVYALYVLFIVASLAGLIIYFKNYKKEKNKILMEIIFVLNIIIPIMLSIYYSYCSDFQPQGRYIMPMLIPLMYFVTTGFESLCKKIIVKDKAINVISIIVSIGLFLLPIYAFLFCIVPIYYK